MKMMMLRAAAAAALRVADLGKRLVEAAEALEGRMDAWRVRWGYTAEEVYAPFWRREEAEG